MAEDVSHAPRALTDGYTPRLGVVEIMNEQSIPSVPDRHMEANMLKKRYIKSRNVSKVTFELTSDELPEAIEPEEIHLVGEFNGWDRSATPMTRRKGGVFRATLELEPGREYQFRYLVNGEHWCNDWNADAYVSGGLGEDNCVVVAPTAH